MSEALAQAMQDLAMSSFESQMNNVYTSIPCVIVAVREGLSGAMVDIQPTINQKKKDGTVEERPPIYGVPVSFPVSSTAGITFPIKAGDTGLAVFSMRSIENWKAGNGRPSAPVNQGKMDKSDAMFIPGIQPNGMSVNNPAKHILPHSTDDIVVFQNLGGVESEVRLKADGSIDITTSNRPVNISCSTATITATDSININSPLMTVNVEQTNWTGNITYNGNITQSGNYTATGTQTFNGIVFATHKHISSIPGQPTGVPIP